ncbi:MAG: tetratricopeptide repeat protein [Alphaproteobacteria bacterium]|nr:tetratricopeptide repeat protein [Alphaproteobacteria bacterium]
MSEAEARLREIGASGEEPFDIGEAALLLGSFDRPGVPLDRYRGHFDELAKAAGSPDRLAATLGGAFGYAGDRATYDDLQNANLLRVIDRRKGLPVALGILYIAAGRRLGAHVEGLDFPGHFLIRVDRTAIVDPFEGGAQREPPALRQLLKAAYGPSAELETAHFRATADRGVLLRLQNNIRLRLARRREFEAALAVLERMTWIAPGLAELVRERAMLEAALGRFRGAVESLERYIAMEPADGARLEAAALIQRFRARLN